MACGRVLRLVACLVVTRWPPAGAEPVILASCYPRLPQTVGVSFDCRGPASSDAPSNVTGWTYVTNAQPAHRECLDEECETPEHHVQLNWFGTTITEYTLSFSIRVTEIHPQVAGLIGLLSVGTGIVIAAAPGDYFMNGPNDLGDGEFHSVEVRATPDICDLLVDGLLVTQVLGTSADPSSSSVPRACSPFGAAPYGAIFGGHVTRSARAIFSKTSGEVKNVVLRAEMPAPLTTPGILIEFNGPDQEWTPEITEAWKTLQGQWVGKLRLPGGACASPDAKMVQLCCMDEVVEVDVDIRFDRSEVGSELWMEMQVGGTHPGLVQQDTGYELVLSREKQLFPIWFDMIGSDYNLTVIAKPYAFVSLGDDDPEITRQMEASMQEDACFNFRPMGNGQLWMSSMTFFSAVPFDRVGTRVAVQHATCPAEYLPEVNGCEPGENRPLLDFLDRHNPNNTHYGVTAVLTKLGAEPEMGEEEVSSQTTTTTGDKPSVEVEQSSGLLFAALGGVGGLVCCCSALCTLVWWRSRRLKKQRELLAQDAEFGNSSEQQPPTSNGSKKSPDGTSPSPNTPSPLPGSFQTPSPGTPGVSPETPGQTPTSGTPGNGNSSSDFTFNIFRRFNTREIAACCHMEHCFIKESDVKLKEKVGSGSFGAVWKGLLYDLTAVAVKVPLDDRGKQDAARVESVANELRIFRRIRHPDIVLFYGGCMMSGDRLSLVLEWVDGCDLKELVRRRRTSGGWDYDIVNDGLLHEFVLLRDVSRGMHYLHVQEPVILHRDLKPANILVETSHDPPHAKIADFGLSFLLEHANPHSRTGTRAYMAPEVFKFEPYSTAADIFSFGCIGVFILKADNPDPAIAQTQLNEMNLKEGYLTLIREVCFECLYFGPKQRPNAASVHDAFTRPKGTKWKVEYSECKTREPQIAGTGISLYKQGHPGSSSKAESSERKERDIVLKGLSSEQKEKEIVLEGLSSEQKEKDIAVEGL